MLKKNLPTIIRVLVSALFLLSVFAKLYPTPIYGITKIFEEGQLIPMGFSETIATYISRFIIGLELFLAITILQRNYLKRLVIPISVSMLILFSLHLLYSIYLGDSENCGCFGDLIPMTPVEALIKNIITLAFLGYLYRNTIESKQNSYSELSIQFLLILLLIFAFIPASKQIKTGQNSFVSYVQDEEFVNLEREKILCFFDAGCEHCQHAARSLDSISNFINNFPPIHIIFSDSEESKIPDFFEFVGNEYPYQIMPFANYDTDKIDSYMEITFPDYDNPVVILYDGVRQLRLYEGGGERKFLPEDLQRILESKK